MLTAPQGGAISRIAPDATAFAYREARHNLLVAAAWNDASGDEAHMTWARGAWKNLEPFTRGFYVNDNNADISERRVLENYGPNYTTLGGTEGQVRSDQPVPPQRQRQATRLRRVLPPRRARAEGIAFAVLWRDGPNGEWDRTETWEGMVPRRGLEPPRIAPLVPETSASTSSATWALRAPREPAP